MSNSRSSKKGPAYQSAKFQINPAIAADWKVVIKLFPKVKFAGKKFAAKYRSEELASHKMKNF